jgi:integrase
MTRYPFRSQAQKFLQEYRHVYSKLTYDERERRLRRMDKDLNALWQDGKISTTDPAKITYDDVKIFYGLLRSRGMSANGIVHELGCLNSLCQFCGNVSVETARKRFPMMQGHKSYRRLPTVPLDVVYKILDGGLKKESFADLRNYAVVAICLCAGLRPIEIMYALRDNLDLDAGVIYVSIVKGRGTYGEPRTAPIHPDGIPLLRKYCAARDKVAARSECLFPATTHLQPLASNTLRQYKKRVEMELKLDCDITFQAGRRTYGQWLIDDRVPAETVSLHMGHRTSKTTETFYARQRESVALEVTKKIWKDRREEREKEEVVN